MAESKPDGTTSRARAKFTYYVEQDYIERTIEETGLEPPRQWTITFDLTSDVEEPSLRRRLREAWRAYGAASDKVVLSEPASDPEDLLSVLEPWLERLSERGGGEAFDREMADWIEGAGSDRLRTAHRRGYKVSRLYAQERLAADLPGVWVDTAGAAKSRTRTDPTSAALDLEGEILEILTQKNIDAGCSIRWVTDPPREVADDYYFEPQEAVVVPEYLGRYTVYVFADEDLLNPGPEEGEE